jgi:ribosome-associated protein
MFYIDQIIPTELCFEATRSSGPGGQHINKSSTAMILRWNLRYSKSYDDQTLAFLIRKMSSLLTNDGEVVIRSEEFRSQHSNKKRCLQKLEQMLSNAFFIPKRRKKTKPSKSSVRKNKEIKKKHSARKKLRKKVSYE